MNRAPKISLGIFLVLLCAIVLEAGLRVAGYRPWTSRKMGTPTSGTYSPDAVLGWRLKPGNHVVERAGRKTELNVWPDGTRATSLQYETLKPQVLLLGCSFVEGWGLEDNQTLGWHLQERLPDYRVVNLGVAGYSTYQVSLALESYLKAHPNPAHVFYGYMPFHLDRTVGLPLWRKRIAEYASSEEIGLPYVWVDASGRSRVFPVERYPSWPLERRLASVSLFRDFFLSTYWNFQRVDKLATAQYLLSKMSKVTSSQGGTFHALRLAEPRIVDPMEASVEVDKKCEHSLSKEYWLTPDDRHPGPLVNQYWAQCFSQKISPKTPELTAG